jgi:hypothetical protein
MNIADIHEDDIGSKTAIDAATNKCKGLKTAFNNKCRACTTAIAEMAGTPDDDHEDRVRETLAQAVAAEQNLEYAFCYLSALLNEDENSANMVALTGRMTSLASNMTITRGAVYAAIAKKRTAAANLPNRGAMAGKSVFNAELRPGDLPLSTTPAEFRRWKEELDSYFASNQKTETPV